MPLQIKIVKLQFVCTIVNDNSRFLSAFAVYLNFQNSAAHASHFTLHPLIILYHNNLRSQRALALNGDDVKITDHPADPHRRDHPTRKHVLRRTTVLILLVAVAVVRLHYRS